MLPRGEQHHPTPGTGVVADLGEPLDQQQRAAHIPRPAPVQLLRSAGGQVVTAGSGVIGDQHIHRAEFGDRGVDKLDWGVRVAEVGGMVGDPAGAGWQLGT